MEIEHTTAETVKVEKVVEEAKYMAFYTTNKSFWMYTYLCDTKQEAVNSIAGLTDISLARIVKIKLPVTKVPEDIDIR